jgi:hypothetical protein
MTIKPALKKMLKGILHADEQYAARKMQERINHMIQID